ncbi:MAG: nicotinate phosphoribosyltransferase, partial [Candidatus Lokiarchaeota archaeon]|nr:nicotinate phosphoribosyltransferase [Candidatus Lokiarchaeota archaeon]MBD3337825.1 nicotinate phosphoribosyltransferase [Candidatus Lokiarchaeota archaeon]
MEDVGSNFAILTDFYQLTMTNGYLEQGIAQQTAVFDLFFRKAPFKGVYAICYGLDKAIQDIAKMKFTNEAIKYLQSYGIFSKQFLEYLKNWKCELTIRSIADGRVVFPYEPIMEVEGPLIQCQLIETYLLNCFNFPTLVATKANRMWLSSGRQPILEFGLRRAQGPNGALTASEAALVGGCSGTSNVLAGKIYGLEAKGTQAHSWVMAFPSELDSFRAYAEIYPDDCILLIDTYDILEGAKNAIIVGKELEEEDKKLRGVRIDSGDLAYFSRKVRKMLDEAGLDYVKIVASNDVDEYIIEEIQRHNGAVDLWGIGTKLATCKDDPALGGVYKLVEMNSEPKLKISSNVEKTTIPCKKNLFRIYDENNFMAGDIMEVLEITKLKEEYVYDPLNPMRFYKVRNPSRVEQLLELRMDGGKIVKEYKGWRQARKNMEKDIEYLS